ncbi:MAG: VWA domain-containing protein, partial [Holophagae bacterium]
LPHVDEFRPVHDLDSLARLAEALSAPLRRASAAAARPATPAAPS